jgi:D-alanyl-D-alanine carboxypeptidase/D-alanyl-D-alanine-endopeptidase (penicillin-binding protein 4)
MPIFRFEKFKFYLAASRLKGLCLYCLLLSGQYSYANQTVGLNNPVFLLTDITGQTISAHHPDKAMIPASTTKLVTAWLALRHWGPQHRFMTPFYFDANDKTLWIKGSGDPYLVSSEILKIASRLSALGIKQIQAIAIDDSLFQTPLQTPGGSVTTNPYDAIPAPLAANFNTVFIAIQQNQVVSAEPETPLTDFARQQAFRIKGHSERINTGQNRQDAGRYFAELLTVFLRRQGVNVGNKILWGKLPENSVPVYQHFNSRPLSEMIRPMMKYSTNFIANQLALLLAAEKNQRPVNFNDVQHVMESTLADIFHWKNFTLKEGAGLSRKNRLSPRQLTELLQAFKPWRELLPQISTGIYAKSGTLNGISTLAGYWVDGKNWQPFALMMQQSLSKRKRLQIVKALIQQKPAGGS